MIRLINTNLNVNFRYVLLTSVQSIFWNLKANSQLLILEFSNVGMSNIWLDENDWDL